MIGALVPAIAAAVSSISRRQSLAARGLHGSAFELALEQERSRQQTIAQMRTFEAARRPEVTMKSCESCGAPPTKRGSDSCEYCGRLRATVTPAPRRLPDLAQAEIAAALKKYDEEWNRYVDFNRFVGPAIVWPR